MQYRMQMIMPVFIDDVDYVLKKVKEIEKDFVKIA